MRVRAGIIRSRPEIKLKEAESMANDSKDSIANFLSRVMSPDGAAAPKNRVRVSIAGQEFVILASESEEYVHRCAALVDARIKNVMGSGRFSLSEAAILAACNIADEQIKATDTAENLRAQIKAYSDEISRLRADVAALRRDSTRRDG